MTDVEDHQSFMNRAPATGLTSSTGTFWDIVDDDDRLQLAAVTSDDDDDDVNLRLSWFQSYCDEQLLQLTPPVDTSSSQSDDSLVPDDVSDHVMTSADTESDEACRAQRGVKVTQGHGIRDDVRTRRRRHRANVRERSRMRSINAAFDRLRALLPPPASRCTALKARRERCGPSKLEILRLAVAYIGRLTRLLYTADRYSEPLSPPVDQHSDAVTGVVVVQSQLHLSQHSGDYRTLRYSLSWSFSDGRRVRSAAADVVAAKLWTPERVYRRPVVSRSYPDEYDSH